MLLRNGVSRLALRSLAAAPRTAGARKTTTTTAAPCLQWSTQFGSLAAAAGRRPQLAAQTTPSALLRRSLADKKLSEGQKQAESRYAHEKIKPTPETVSSSSSTHPMFSEVGAEAPAKEVDMTAEIKHDVGTIKQTFSLANVPREAYYMGLAGTLPYLATSLSTVYLSWELNHSTAGYGMLFSEANATYLLHMIEPLQIGYGASILSFLGAIHWGLEWAGYGGAQGYKRYAIGVVAPMVAWSTLLMPVEGALIGQFMGFLGLYYVDTRAAYRGWTPDWYAVYRFVLTSIVGASIVLTLIGRSELPEHIPGSIDRAKVFKGEGSSEEKLAQHEKAAAEKKKTAARSDDRGEK
ncbi:repeatdomain containing protein [Pyrenophora tritici-repentis]|uniref:DUF3429 containing protein n=2 Tax=Pyrenophora tritici-repentis TaxID=45151 RepID=A0A2W1ETF0_9PLEO|nr:uncharacterized protein PTRG_02661 [Pyrenophora tritici-repentis Pt-1C-BFP]KAA8623275.1 DUF3429 domain-containing protein [Pyrenophora tritici-repentis]EDU45184.1 conserved hypothetical protein [Pyrenophora tritici-repentis Pt-1C-BFP]KAF7452274.1 DUF3429 domain containing protein [Pyrenophora tritici-repentis]KAF7574604.1 DUF3429 domain containing protein [Pyrenophora tritici-repentis]KAG9386615.1 DUF3429 domain containing protein [Pyrenophora tritici-repentis]